MDNVIITVNETTDAVLFNVIEGVVPSGTYISDADAINDGKVSGGHYYLAQNNIYGLPKNIIKKID